MIAVATIEVLSRTLFRLPTPIAPLATVTVYAAYVGGLRPGLASAAIGSVYGVYYFSGALYPPSYSEENILRLVTLVVALVVLAAVIGGLQLAARSSEEALQRQLDFNSDITANLVEGVCAVDLGGRVVSINPATESILGWTEADLLGEEIHSVVHSGRVGDTPSCAVDCPLRSLGSPVTTSRNRDDVFVHRDGKVLPVAFTSSPIVSAGRVIGAVVAFRDMSSSNREAEELRRSRDQLEAIFDGVADGITVQDPTGQLVYANAAAALVLGCSSVRELLDTPLAEIMAKFELMDDAGRPLSPSQLPGRLALEGVQSAEATLRFRIVATSEERWAVVKSTPVFDVRSRMQLAVNVFHDVTDRKRTEWERDELLAQAEHSLEFHNQFLSLTTHELSNPVTLVKGYADLLLEGAQRRDDADLLDSLQVIHRQADRMTRLLNQLLNISRLEGGKLDLDMLPFDFNVAVKEVVGEARLSSPSFELQLYERATGLWIQGDRRHIQQVMTNLLSNAIRYSDSQSRVDIIIEGDERRALLSITDYGVGIPEQQQTRVFDLYFRGQWAPSKSRDGLGVGLFISKAIVERHGGTITVTSKVGQGSTFHLSLPVACPTDDRS